MYLYLKKQHYFNNKSIEWIGLFFIAKKITTLQDHRFKYKQHQDGKKSYSSFFYI